MGSSRVICILTALLLVAGCSKNANKTRQPSTDQLALHEPEAQPPAAGASDKYADERKIVEGWLNSKQAIQMVFDFSCYDGNPPPRTPNDHYYGGGGTYENTAETARNIDLWATNRGYVTETVTPVHVMADGTGPINWYHICPTPTPEGQAIFKGTNFIVLGDQRTVTSWDYENEYEADVPEKGKVKMYAVRLTFTVPTAVQGISLGSGSLQLKMGLDPDTGRWEVGETQMSDPSISITP